jgi:hypothetical protein
MRMPQHIADRGASWRDVIATWLVAALVFGLIGLSDAVFRVRADQTEAAEPPIFTVAAKSQTPVE